MKVVLCYTTWTAVIVDEVSYLLSWSIHPRPLHFCYLCHMELLWIYGHDNWGFYCGNPSLSKVTASNWLVKSVCCSKRSKISSYMQLAQRFEFKSENVWSEMLISAYTPVSYTLWGYPPVLRRVSKPQARGSSGWFSDTWSLALSLCWHGSGRVGTSLPLVLCGSCWWPWGLHLGPTNTTFFGLGGHAVAIKKCGPGSSVLLGSADGPDLLWSFSVFF